MARTRSRMRRWVVISLGLFAIPLTYVAQAFHTFPDVDSSAFYHSQVEWIFNRAITTGCGGGLYCPTSNVTRGQMAVFMRNLGVALTPTVLTVNGNLGGVDLDVLSVVCTTGSNYNPTFPQRAILYTKASLESAAGDFSYWVFPMVSPDGGTTWTTVGGFTNGPESAAPTTGHQSPNFNVGYQDLTPGTSYRFGIRLLRASAAPGTADPDDGWCGLHVEIVNRNPGSSPLIREEQNPEDGSDQRQLATR